jgi:4-amino-4-deoxy-L-arabinose transferase-like glycosyltransferase
VLLAAAGTALGLVVVRADLAAALAAALIGAALLAGDPEGRTPVSAGLAGAAFGAAVLAFPGLGLALPLAVAALAFHPRTRDVTVAHGFAGLLGAVLVVAPWQRWLVDRFSTWSPAAEVEVPLSSALALLVVLAAVAIPLLTPHLPTPEG